MSLLARLRVFYCYARELIYISSSAEYFKKEVKFDRCGYCDTFSYIKHKRKVRIKKFFSHCLIKCTVRYEICKEKCEVCLFAFIKSKDVTVRVVIKARPWQWRKPHSLQLIRSLQVKWIIVPSSSVITSCWNYFIKMKRRSSDRIFQRFFWKYCT